MPGFRKKRRVIRKKKRHPKRANQMRLMRKMADGNSAIQDSFAGVSMTAAQQIDGKNPETSMGTLCSYQFITELTNGTGLVGSRITQHVQLHRIFGTVNFAMVGNAVGGLSYGVQNICRAFILQIKTQPGVESAHVLPDWGDVFNASANPMNTYDIYDRLAPEHLDRNGNYRLVWDKTFCLNPSYLQTTYKTGAKRVRKVDADPQDLGIGQYFQVNFDIDCSKDPPTTFDGNAGTGASCCNNHYVFFCTQQQAPGADYLANYQAVFRIHYSNLP